MATSILTVDTSVIVPSLLTWHALHSSATAALEDVQMVPGHALVESFSVLTRLPTPRGLGADQARHLLKSAFPGEPLILSPDGYMRTIDRLAVAGLGGGRIYDALIGATAAESGFRLLTADRRAMATYALVGADFQLVG